MNTKQSLHIHTTYADGNDKPEDIVIEAIKRAFASIGFSEHTYNKFSIYPYQLAADKIDCRLDFGTVNLQGKFYRVQKNRLN